VTGYLRLNRAQQDERAPAHAASPGCSRQRFIDDPAYLGDVVRFDRPRPGDVDGLRTVHLQCHTVTHQWNHGLGEIVTAVRDAGLDLSMPQEHDSAPWDALPGRTVAGEHRLADRPWRLPQTYTLQARTR
jgi:hypothetical protein